MNSMRILALCVLLAAAGCASKPPAEVSRDELSAVRASHAKLRPGMPKDEALGSFKSGNAVKLGSAMIDGAAIEEWKVEAFHDDNDRKDLFVTFLYFCDERLVDSSDTRINFRTDAALMDRWRGVR